LSGKKFTPEKTEYPQKKDVTTDPKKSRGQKFFSSLFCKQFWASD
jgi:hypothetical protein